jgi:transcriptional regulator with XRE-family HTH domain
MDAKKLGKRIKLARVEHDLTQLQLAEKIQVIRKTVSQYETGVSIPSLEVLEKMCKVLKKPYMYFLKD